MMPLARSRLRPATGPATGPVRARAAEAGGGPAPTIPPAASRPHRQPPHPPPLPPPLLAIFSPPRSPWHVQLLKPKLLLCPQLDLVGDHAVGLDSPRAGVREVKFWPGRAWSHLRRLPGESSSESCCCSLQQQWQHSAMAPMTGCDPSEDRPQSLGLLEGDSLLNAASTKLCGLNVTYGVP
jgi:hypothetical protein